MPLPLIGIFLLAAAAFAVIVILVLTLKAIKEWFIQWKIKNKSSNKNSLSETDKNLVGFTVKQKISQNKFKTVQGVFNEKTNEIQDGRVIDSEKIDKDLDELYEGEELIIFS